MKISIILTALVYIALDAAKIFPLEYFENNTYNKLAQLGIFIIAGMIIHSITSLFLRKKEEQQ